MKTSLPVVLSMALVFLSSCATIVNGSKQTVSFMSEPSRATITVGGEFTTQTPAALPLKRGKDYLVLVQKDGYDTKTVTINSSFVHWVQATLGNVWNYILPGLVVDAISGGAYEFDQPLVNVILTKSVESGASTEGQDNK